MSSGGSYRKRRMRYRVVPGIDGRERVIAFEAKPRKNMDDQTGGVIWGKIHPDPEATEVEAHLDAGDIAEGDRKV